MIVMMMAMTPSLNASSLVLLNGPPVRDDTTPFEGVMETMTIPATTIAAAGRLLLAAGCGAAIGLNREWHHKPAGLRTHALVALGTALAALLALDSTPLGSGPDDGAVSRVMQGILAGVGFIGGGVILHRDDAKGAHGLTTAASIWVTSTIVLGVGLGLWRTALWALALTLVILMFGRRVDRRVRGTHDETHGA